jgi:hypothetical protein
MRTTIVSRIASLANREKDRKLAAMPMPSTVGMIPARKTLEGIW